MTNIVKDLKRAEDDLVWFYENQKTLRPRYLRQWVAVKDLRVVMADADRRRLVQRLGELAHGPRRAMIVYVEPEGTVHIY